MLNEKKLILTAQAEDYSVQNYIHAPKCICWSFKKVFTTYVSAAHHHQRILPVSSVYKYFALKQNKVLQAEITASFL
jgi:hypothetical protein